MGDGARRRGWRMRLRAGKDAVYGRSSCPAPNVAVDADCGAAEEEAIVRFRHVTVLCSWPPIGTVAPKKPLSVREGGRMLKLYSPELLSAQALVCGLCVYLCSGW